MNPNHDNYFEWLLEQFKNKNFEDTFNTLNNLESSLKDQLYNDIKKYAYDHIKPKDINTIQDLAILLNGNEYGDELKNDIDLDVEKFAKNKNWLIVFPCSDDLLEFRGIIDDELDAYDGVFAKFVKQGDFYLEDIDDYGERDAKYLKASYDTFVETNIEEKDELLKKGSLYVESIWEPEGKDLVWGIESNAKHYATFTITEDDNDWATGLIIDMNEYK